MGWWNRRRDASSIPTRDTPEGISPDLSADAMVESLDAVLDTVGVLLREYGRGAFDIEAASARDTRERCESWAKHLLSGGPRPGDEASKECLALGRRDWRGVRQFLAAHRRDEGRYVNKSITDLRQSLWTLIQVLDSTVEQDEEADNQVQKELEQLKAAAQSGSTETIRRAVASAVGAIGKISVERKRKQREQMKGMHSRLKELGEQLEVARQESAVDPLTSLYNRRALDDRLSQALTMGRVFDQRSCLVLVDLDHFKRINDTHGHPAGDEVLRTVADCLARTFRVKNDFVARYGGEEFAVILWDTPLKRGLISAERLQEAVRTARVQYGGREIRVTASMGIAEVAEGDTAAQWVERADKALYNAKHRGRDRIEEASTP